MEIQKQCWAKAISVHIIMRLLLDKISTLNTKPEVTVICVDNSYLLTDSRGGSLQKAQAKAIALYAEEKIKAHDCNEVGLLAMGAMIGTCYIRPTRDLSKIRFALKGLAYICEPQIPIVKVLNFFSNSPLPNRRLLVFYGGRLDRDIARFQFYAKRLKEEYAVAVDVVNFGIQYWPKTKKKLLKAFVEAADNRGNSHYLYAPSGSKLSLSQQILRSPLALRGLPMQEEEREEEEREGRRGPES